ncbi:DUF1481 domain-containing protein [Vibrio tritonius]|uniref:DUF1481 domain-containing protein n=1 Tax=Vibrio tritonius TaxID=1435069 RepID=UPI0008380A12|nr:DUF1481 domain-containing protein [Vibrio tritonius]
MKSRIVPFLFAAVLAGCSSSISTPKLVNTQHYTGGERIGDEARYYWFTEKNNVPDQASDYVIAGPFNWYKTTYRWEDGFVREVSRVGERLQNEEVAPFETLLRFDSHGEAIYQRYRLDGKVLPLSSEQIDQYVKQARYVSKVTQDQKKQGLELIQGVWNGQEFDRCNDAKYQRLQFNDTLPSLVINRLASLDSYVAFIGKVNKDSVYIDTLLTLAEGSHGCMQAPDLLAK